MNEPKDYEYLLLCDGSTISKKNYPELVAVLGGTQLPNLIDRFLQGSATAGTYKEAGLPNVYGTVDGYFNYSGATEACSLINWSETVHATTTGAGYHSFSINLSKSNPIYGNSRTVQPPAFTTKIYICYAG